MEKTDPGERRPYLPVIDAFRGWAILGIVLLHAMLYAGVLTGPGRSASRIVEWGTVGNVLDAFFILSGFSLFLSVVARRGELGGRWRFLVRRAARLYPPYWLVIGVMLVTMAIALPHSIPVGYPSPGQIALELAAIQMPARLLDGSLTVGFGVNGVLWFVSVMAGLSIAFAFVARPYYRHPLVGLAAAAAVTLGWLAAARHLPGLFTALEGHHTPQWVVQLIAVDQVPGWAFSFALGMTGAWAYVRATRRWTPEELHRFALRMAPVAVAAMALAVYLFGLKAEASQGSIAPSVGRSVPWIQIVYPLALGGLMAVILLAPAWLSRPLAVAPIREIGLISYGVFLIHAFIGRYLGVEVLNIPADGSWRSAVLFFALMLAVSIPFALFSRRYVERPSRRWADRVTAPGPEPGYAEPEPEPEPLTATHQSA